MARAWLKLVLIKIGCIVTIFALQNSPLRLQEIIGRKTAGSRIPRYRYFGKRRTSTRQRERFSGWISVLQFAGRGRRDSWDCWGSSPH